MVDLCGLVVELCSGGGLVVDLCSGGGLLVDLCSGGGLGRNRISVVLWRDIGDRPGQGGG